jgi:hypothetical protein
MTLRTVASSTSSSLATGVLFVHSVVLVGGTANSTVTIDDSTDGSGTSKIQLKALANDSKVLSFGDGNSVKFDTGVYATLVGAGARVYVYIK